MRRPRRNRKSASIRSMISETSVKKQDLIYPLFLVEGIGQKIEVDSMPGIFRFSKDNLLKEIAESMELGLRSFCVFPSLPDAKKDKVASEAFVKEGLYLDALATIKKEFPECSLMTDVALDP